MHKIKSEQKGMILKKSGGCTQEGLEREKGRKKCNDVVTFKIKIRGFKIKYSLKLTE